jgi:uncharacterized membrane protein
MTSHYVWLLAFLIGVVAGLRSLTAPAIVAWAANLGWIHLGGTKHAFMASSFTVGIFSILAIAELIADKLPKTPKRTAAVGLIARIVLGGLSGASLSLAGHQGSHVGLFLGAIGGVVGAYAGYFARTGTVRALHLPDFVIALAEDAIAIGGALLIVTRF